METKHIILITTFVLLLLILRNKIKLAVAAAAPSLGVGTNDVDHRDRSDLVRGLRNNNPGNLKQTKPRQGWVGSVDNPSDPIFEEFERYVYGVRAMTKLIRNKVNAGYNTPRKLIYNWAPPSDNNPTDDYVYHVATTAAIGINDTINPNDKELIKAIAIAIEGQENGMVVMTDDDFDHAWSLL